MNIPNILDLAEKIEARAIRLVDFNMNEIADEGKPGCNSAGCFIGCAIAIKYGQFVPLDWRREDQYEENKRRMNAMVSEAATYLGLNPSMANELFFPDSYEDTPFTKDGSEIGLDDVTPEWAAGTLRALAKTGEVDWLAAAPEEIKKEMEDLA